MKSVYVVRAEESLRDYILDEFKIEIFRTTDSRKKADIEADAYKYRGLSLVVTSAAVDSIPKIIVQIASGEATFSIESGKKIDGGMNTSDIRLVEKWLAVSTNKTLLMNIWTGAFKEKFVELKPFDSI